VKFLDILGFFFLFCTVVVDVVVFVIFDFFLFFYFLSINNWISNRKTVSVFWNRKCFELKRKNEEQQKRDPG